MSDYLITGTSARWSVIWLVKKKGQKPRLVEIDFENDLQGAIELYTKAKTAGKKLVTLRSCNVGFPPPEKYRPRMIQVRKFKWVIVERKGKKYRKKKWKVEERYITPMRQLNEDGIWWCPYCRKMRRFQRQDAFHSSTMGHVPIQGIHCPICGISHRDGHVRKWNPQASVWYNDPPWERRRRSKSSGKRKRRGSTRKGR